MVVRDETNESDHISLQCQSFDHDHHHQGRESADPHEISYSSIGSDSTDPAAGLAETDVSAHDVHEEGADVNVRIDESSDLQREEDNEEETYDYKVVKTVEEGKSFLKESKAALCLVELASKYTVKQFQKLFPGDKVYGCHARLNDGQIQIFELPSRVHEAVGSAVYDLLKQQNRHILSMRSGDITISDNTLLQPDDSYYIRSFDQVIPGAVDHKQMLLPKIVVEVSYSEGYSSISALPKQYFSIGNGDGVQGVLLFFVRKCTVRGREEEYQMVVLYYQCGHNDLNGDPVPTIAKSFGHYLVPVTKNKIVTECNVPEGLLEGVGIGGGPCNSVGLPLYRLEIPYEALWHGYSPEARALMQFAEDPFIIDLFEVQRRVVVEG